jgi:hypothetical protein
MKVLRDDSIYRASSSLVASTTFCNEDEHANMASRFLGLHKASKLHQNRFVQSLGIPEAGVMGDQTAASACEGW